MATGAKGAVECFGESLFYRNVQTVQLPFYGNWQFARPSFLSVPQFSHFVWPSLTPYFQAMGYICSLFTAYQAFPMYLSWNEIKARSLACSNEWEHETSQMGSHLALIYS